LANITGHMTPAMVAAEVSKLPAGTRIVVTHLKAPFREEVAQELMALNIPCLELCESGREYDFGEP
ncbi:MAG TPA: hypothetical protein VFV87_07835, partial [Pirellulaceae bacterium]|nr:hypothetical protein [Pirellulaceae bacterium]